MQAQLEAFLLAREVGRAGDSHASKHKGSRVKLRLGTVSACDRVEVIDLDSAKQYQWRLIVIYQATPRIGLTTASVGTVPQYTDQSPIIIMCDEQSINPESHNPSARRKSGSFQYWP